MPRLDFRKTFSAAEIAAAVPRETCRTSYDNHPRVAQDGSGGVHVTRSSGASYHVVNEGIAGWCIRDPLGHVIQLPGGEYAADFRSADDAIHCLIGGPRP